MNNTAGRVTRHFPSEHFGGTFSISVCLTWVVCCREGSECPADPVTQRNTREIAGQQQQAFTPECALLASLGKGE